MAVESADIAPVDGLTLKAAIGASYRDSGWKGERLNVKDWKTDHSNTWLIAGSLKASYKSDKFNIDFATDHVLQTNPSQTPFNFSDDPRYSGATMVKGQFAPVTADIFFSNRAVSNQWEDKEYYLFGGTYTENDFDYANEKLNGSSENHDVITKVKKYYYSTQGLPAANVVENLFSAQLGFDFQKLWDKVPVSVRVQGLNIISDYRIISAFVDTTLLDGSLKLTVYGKDLLASFKKVNPDNDLNPGDYYGKFQSDMGSFYYWDENGSKQKIGVDATYLLNDAITIKGGAYLTAGNTKIGGNVGATYKADIFTADASVAGEFDYYNEGNNIENAKHRNQGKLQAKASVKSDKIVDGAILSLTYESGNILNTGKAIDWFVGQQAGKLTAKCRVNF
jgi:hypothetical protein